MMGIDVALDKRVNLKSDFRKESFKKTYFYYSY